MSRLTPESEAKIRDHWTKNLKNNGFTFFGYEELLAEIDELRAEVASRSLEEIQKENTKLQARIQELSEMNSNGCDLLAAAYEERDRLRKVADAARGYFESEAQFWDSSLLSEALRELDAPRTKEPSDE